MSFQDCECLLFFPFFPQISAGQCLLVYLQFFLISSILRYCFCLPFLSILYPLSTFSTFPQVFRESSLWQRHELLILNLVCEHILNHHHIIWECPSTICASPILRNFHPLKHLNVDFIKYKDKIVIKLYVSLGIRVRDQNFHKTMSSFLNFPICLERISAKLAFINRRKDYFNFFRW